MRKDKANPIMECKSPKANNNHIMQFSANYDLIRNKVADKRVEEIPTKMGNVVTIKTSELSKKYKFYNANRGEGKEQMDMARVRKIAKSIIGSGEVPGVYDGTYWLVEPIIVNAKTGVVADGHYTWAALEMVRSMVGWDLPVIVIERDFPKTLTQMQVVSMFNNCRKPWQSSDFVECYVKEGLPDYIKLKEAAITLGGPFVKKNGKPNYKYVVALMENSDYPSLKKGTFMFKPGIIERGERVKELFYAISKTMQTSNWFEQFIKAYTQAECTLGEKAFSRLIAHAGEIILDGCTDTEGWKSQFRKFL